MQKIIANFYQVQSYLCAYARKIDWLPPLLIRLYLAPVLIIAGLHKFEHFAEISAWFGNSDWGLGLPLPGLMTFLAASAEFFGGLLLLFGLATRWISVPLIFTMLVAITSVHAENGWFAIAPSNPETSSARALAAIGLPAAKASLENSVEVDERLTRTREILREHGNYDWLTEKGNLVTLNNGIEFAVTYLIMLLALIFSGGGRLVSADYWLHQKIGQKFDGLEQTDDN